MGAHYVTLLKKRLVQSLHFFSKFLSSYMGKSIKLFTVV